MDFEKELKQLEEAIELTKSMGKKDKSKLVYIQKPVNKKGKQFTQGFWVSPEEAKKFKSDKKDSNNQPKKQGKHFFQLNGSIEELKKLNPGSESFDGFHMLNFSPANTRIYLANKSDGVFLGCFKEDDGG